MTSEETTQQVDPFTTAILRAGIHATTEEMKTNLMRTAYNSIVYESLDFTVALTDEKGNLVSIGLGLPSFIRGIADTVKAMVKYYGKEIYPGDILLTNDIYTHGSEIQHMIAALPIFSGDEIVGYACSEPHWGSWGGLVGAYSPDVFSSGLQVPYCKVYKRGVLDREILDFIALNIREPELGLGDFRGMIACVRTGEKRILQMTRKYGNETYKGAVRALMDQAEEFSKREIAKIPEGTYEAEEFLDDDGLELGKHLPIKVKVIVKGDHMTVDLTGTAKQVRGQGNSRAGVTGVQMGFKSVFCPEWFPVNEGSFRPVDVVLPEGTIVSAARPASFILWMCAPMAICDTFWKAMQQAAPDKVSGGHHADLAVGNAMPINPKTGLPQRLRIAVGGLAGGGFGAVYNSDGMSGTVCMNDGDTHNNPTEAGEAHDATAMCVRYELRPDSGGAGKYRGGLGTVREVLHLTECMVQSIMERSMNQPFGALGAKPGMGNGFAVAVPKEAPSAEVLLSSQIFTIPRTYTEYPNEKRPNAKVIGVRFPAGVNTVVKVGGGGGYGNPLERDPIKVLDDVLNGYVSVESARRDYGVVVDTKAWKVQGLER